MTRPELTCNGESTGRTALLLLLWFLLLAPERSAGQTRPAPAATNRPAPMVLTVEGTNVWIQRGGTNKREEAYPSQVLQVGDRGYTGRRSRATVRLTDLSVARVNEESEFGVDPVTDPKSDGSFNLLRGVLYLLHRDRPGSHRFNTPTATAATRGTEFVLEVEAGTGRTLLTVLEGEAELRNEAGLVVLASGEQGVAARGQAPSKTAVIDTTHLVQWCLYYPGILDISELELTNEERTALGPSLEAWRQGDLLQAVVAYPATRPQISSDEQVYAAALLLAVGQVAQAEQVLDSLTNNLAGTARPRRLSEALRQVIHAVKLRPFAAPLDLMAMPPLATEWLAASYSRQAAGQLAEALEAAKRSVEVSPNFAFGWVRVAELEFSYGRIPAALRALERGLPLAPRNAQALALRGFLLSAQNRTREAIGFFEQAMAIDGGLGNAWLGRGLCRIRRGDTRAGRFDLQVAATLEPQRSLLRSYLGKGFSQTADARRAERELELARHLDAGDPTPWLYSALLLQQQNRLNEAIRDLDRSQDLNDNRQLYRSRLALDQDRAVRGANLASVYRDAGLGEVSLREAGRAVTADYANDAAHLFLANSYNQLRDPKRFDLRYETATISEYLLGNLLAPVGAGALSQPLSQQEYGRLLERDRVGVASSTEYRSNGDWIQTASQFGTFGNTAYSADLGYRFENGARPNNELEQLEAGLSVKQQLTPQDVVLLQATYYNLETGDVTQYYDQAQANPLLHVEERQEPVLLAGYHHEWGPGQHTLLLASRLHDVYEMDNPLQVTLFFNRGFSGPIGSVAPMRYDQTYRSELEIYSAELQQIWQHQSHTLVVGARVQAGEIQTRNEQSDGILFNGSPVGLTLDQNFTSELDRESVYAYDHWQVWETLILAGGLTYDRVRFPVNYRSAPITDTEAERERVSPKAGFIFTPRRDTTLRGAYSSGLGGVSLDQSYRIEPSQVAGFNQAYRSLIPESVADANTAPSFETWSLSLEQQFGTGTYLGLSGEILSSEVNRQVGVVQFSVPTVPGPALTAQQTRETLDFRERSLFVTLNQLVGKDWAFGARYRLSKADLEDQFPGIPDSATLLGGFQADQDLESVLHQVNLSAYYNHASGFFGGASAIWTQQSNQGYTPDRPGDDFWQFNLEAGARFFRRRLQASVALLNLTDQDYRLNPLNLTSELPRERTLAVRLQFNF